MGTEADGTCCCTASPGPEAALVLLELLRLCLPGLPS
jgi:hypothetical protein